MPSIMLLLTTVGIFNNIYNRFFRIYGNYLKETRNKSPSEIKCKAHGAQKPR